VTRTIHITQRLRVRASALACLASLSVLGALAPLPAAVAAPLHRGVLFGAMTQSKLTVSATLEQCLTSEEQDERSATFAGEMTAIAGTAKMEMRIDVLERTPEEGLYRTVSAPGLGVWRSSAPGVKIYKYLKQVTNLTGPAFYRAAVRFRWLNAKGRLIATTELHTRRCEQPAPATPTNPPTSGGEGSSGSGTSETSAANPYAS
jgi:hypothetical protein